MLRWSHLLDAYQSSGGGTPKKNVSPEVVVLGHDNAIIREGDRQNLLVRGIEFLLRQRKYVVPVIAQTSYGQPGDA